MTRNNIMAKRLRVAALSALLIWSMPGTPAFAEGVAEIAAEAQAQAAQQADAAENADGAGTAADERAGAEGAKASTDEAGSSAAPSADESLASALSADGQDAAAADAGDEDADAQQARDARIAKAGETVTVSSADELPTTIEAGAVVRLAADISLDADQQIESVAGTLDGQGHSIALNGKALAKSVSGVVQNLGVTGSMTIGGIDGAIATTCSGTVQMCWSTANPSDDNWTFADAAGIVGTLDGGSVLNSYYAGSLGGMPLGGYGIVAWHKSGTVANILFTDGDQACGYKTDPSFGSKISIDELKTQASVDKLNTDAPATGFSWSAQGGLPVLVSGSAVVVVNKDALKAAIDDAGAKVESDYTAESWAKLADALEAAQGAYANDDATQTEVNAAAKALTDAVAALEKPKPTEPVAQPQNVVHLSSQDDLSLLGTNKFKPADADAYYVLDNDITIDDAEWFFAPTDMLAGTLDGQGHTITFANGGGVQSLMKGVASTGVVQNISFAGELKQAMDGKAFGPLGNSMQGAVLNCSTSVTGKGVAGFARTLDGGIVSNCVSVSEGTAGALFATYSAGQLVNTYWGAYLTNKMDAPASALVNSYAVDPADMASDAFADLINANCGANGSGWGIDKNGTPVFGSGNSYKAPEDTTPDDAYTVTFTANDGAKQTVADHVLEVSPDAVNGWRQLGTFALEGVPATSTITWGTDDANRGNISIDESTGELYIYDNATGTVTATEHKADGTEQTVATIKIKAKAKQFDDFELWYRAADGAVSNVTDGIATVQGSEVRNLEVRVHYVGAAEGEYVPVSFSRFHFVSSDPTTIYGNDYSACFYFKRAGSATITVTPRDAASASAGAKSVTLTSEPVAATSISMGYNEDGATVYLQGRNPLSERGAFLTDHARPVVTPDNATDRDNFTVTSSDPSVAAYTTSGEIGYTAYKAGATTFTATLPDTDAQGNAISASCDVTYAYQNPLKSVTAGTGDLYLKAGATQALDLTFAGENDADGWSVTEPGLTWTFKTLDGKDASDIVSIDRNEKGAWKHVDGAPDDGLYVASTDYTVTALKAGTVVATGTPVDTTAGAEPVTVTITVAGVAASPATSDSASAGIDSAAAFIDARRSADAFQYGDEWEIYDFAKAGRTIDSKLLDNYRASLKQHKAEWGSATSTLTETERVALALSAIGEDITDFDGVNLVELICGRTDMDRANEKIFALMALSASGVDAPAGAAWTRDALVGAVCELLGSDDAVEGTRLGDVDLTAMAIQAVAPYAGDSEVDAAIDNGLAYLKGKMNAGTCDFGSAEANAQVVLALLSLDRDPANPVNGFANAVTNVVCALDLYRVEGGNGYAHSKGGAANAMATEQALRALTTYRVSSGEAIAWKTSVTAGKGSGSNEPQKPTVVPGGQTPGAGSGSGAGAGAGAGSGAGTAGSGAGGFAAAMAPVAAKAAGAAATGGAQGAATSESGEKAATESSASGKAASGTSGSSSKSGKAATLSASAGDDAADAGQNGFAIAGVTVGVIGVVAIGGWCISTKRRAA